MVEETKKITSAQYAHCAECDMWLGSPYWSLSKSVALHERGTGHKVTLLRLIEGAAISVENRNLSQAW